MIDREEDWCTDCGSQLLPWEGGRYAGRCEMCHEDWERMEAAAVDREIEAEQETMPDEIGPPFRAVSRLTHPI